MWALAETWGNRLISTGVFLVLARLLGPASFGLVALAIIFIELGNRLVNQGFGAAIVQRQDLDRAHLDTAFWVSLGSGAGLAALAILTAPLLADLFDAPRLTAVLQVLSLRYVVDGLSNVQQSILQRDLRFRSFAVRRLVATSAGGAAGLTLALAGAGVWSLVVQNLVQGTVGVVTLWTISTWRPRFTVSGTHFREMIGFSSSVVGIAMLRFLNTRGEKLLIGAVLTPVALGFYTVALRFPDILAEAFNRSVGRVAFPVFARLQDDRERQVRALLAAARLATSVSAPAFVALAVLAPEVVRVLIGTKWEASIILVQLLAVQGLLRSQLAFAGSVVMGAGRASLMLGRTAIETLVKFGVIAIAVPHGITAVAIAVVASSYATAPLTLWVLRRASGVDLATYLRQLVRPVALALSMGAAIAGVKALLVAANHPDAAVVLVVGLAAGGAVYVGLALVFAPDLVADMRSTLARLRGRSRS
jgi:PST family polysaccharide transporter